MRSIYGSAVRQYLTEKVELLRVHVYGQDIPQFENVHVSPAVVVFRKRQPQAHQKTMLTTGGGLATPEFSETVTLEDLRRSPTWRVPLATKTEDLKQFRIGDLFTVRRGIATGANEFFIMTRDRAKALGIPKAALKPLLPKVRALRSDIVETLPDGYPKVSPQLCVISCDLSEGEIRKRYPRLMKYLAVAKNSGLLSRRLLKDRNPWYKQEHRSPPPFLCTYMGRGSQGKLPLRFIWNKSQAIATNTYLLLYPRQPLAKIIARRPGERRHIFAALQHSAANGMRDHARVHAGGLFKIEPRELANVRIDLPPTLGADNVREQLSFFS